MSEKFDWGQHSISGEDVFLAGWDTLGNLDDANKYCTQIAKSHYENFVISNYLTPPEIRQHIENIYAFCRYGDDLGDEAPFPPSGRVKLLEAWKQDLSIAAENNWDGNPRHPILIAVADTAKKFKIPVKPFLDLIHAFTLDQTKTIYKTWDELRDYCKYSADPVGHLFLYIYGHDDDELRALSDYTCTALQLANHWQDISRDLVQDRIYLPLQTMDTFGYKIEDYQNKVYDERWIKALKFEVDRAQEWFDKGKPLWDKVDKHLSVDLEMFTLGGEEILKSIRKQNYNTWKKRPKVSKFKQLRLFFTAKRKWKKANSKHSKK
jgi:squalene synthase HpnC